VKRHTYPFALLLTITSLKALAFDIKGIEVDKPTDCARIKSLEIRQGTFFPACENGRDKWFVQISFLSGKAEMALHQSPDRILLSILISNFNFNEALDALSGKWGSPQIIKSTVQNRYGASFEQIEATWRDGDAIMKLHKHSARIDSPSLFIIGKEGLSASQKEAEEIVKRNQRNI
jgi:hypothetical protein